MTKRILLLILLLLWSSFWVNPAQALTQWCEDANIIGCHTFNVDESPIEDISSNNADFTLTGAGEPNFTASGKFDGAYDYDGSNDRLYYGANPPNGAFTIVAYVNCETASRGISSYDENTTSSGVTDRYIIVEADGTVSFTVYSGGVRKATSTSTIEVDGSKYNHIAATIDTGSGSSIWVEGVNEDTNAAGTNGYNGYGSGNLIIGTANVPSSADYFNGLIDEVAWFSSTLDSTDINDIMDNGLVQASTRRIMMITKLRREHPWDEEYVRPY